MHTKEYTKEIETFQDKMELALLGYKAGLWEWDTKDNSVTVSSQWKKMLGYENDELPDTLPNWEEFVHPDDIEDIKYSLFNSIKNRKEKGQRVHRERHKDGHWIWVLSRALFIYRDDGSVHIIGLHTDISDQKELELSYYQQAQIIDQVHDIIVSVDLDGHITSWNRGAKKILGYTKNEVLQKDVSILYPKEGTTYKNIKKALSILKHNKEFHLETVLRKKDDQTIFVDLSLSVLRDENGILCGFVGYAQDITKRKDIEAQLKKQRINLDYLAHHDILTGLPNRLMFQETLKKVLAKSKRFGKKFAVFFIDLDYFKDINDSFGHEVGDKVLQKVTNLFLDRLRVEDTLARLGGDEFAILIENISDTRGVAVLAHKLLDIFCEPIEVEQHHFYLSCSIGISIFPDDATDEKTLLKHADAAMYTSKEKGRGGYNFYEHHITSNMMRRVVFETQLKDALKSQELVVYFQTQTDTHTNDLIGLEALVRWQHPTLGLIAPHEFLHIAEVTGMIVAIDRYVLNYALSQYSLWQAQGLEPGVLAFNIARQHLIQNDFLEYIETLLKKYNINGECIEFELTEAIIMEKPQDLEPILQGISTLGIQITIDNFGTAYSSLLYLKKLPISKLKIDRSFIQKISSEDSDEGIVTKSTIELAKNFNLHVLAEGVETQEQKEILNRYGCHVVQGYIYTKPMSSQELKELLLQKKS